MSAVLISAVQSVKIFGFWRQPVLTLSWTDIKQHNLTWRQLRALGLEAEMLKRVQPDKAEWIQRGGIQVADLIMILIGHTHKYCSINTLPKVLQ